MTAIGVLTAFSAVAAGSWTVSKITMSTKRMLLASVITVVTATYTTMYSLPVFYEHHGTDAVVILGSSIGAGITIGITFVFIAAVAMYTLTAFTSTSRRRTRSRKRAPRR